MSNASSAFCVIADAQVSKFDSERMAQQIAASFLLPECNRRNEILKVLHAVEKQKLAWKMGLERNDDGGLRIDLRLTDLNSKKPEVTSEYAAFGSPPPLRALMEIHFREGGVDMEDNFNIGDNSSNPNKPLWRSKKTQFVVVNAIKNAEDFESMKVAIQEVALTFVNYMDYMFGVSQLTSAPVQTLSHK